MFFLYNIILSILYRIANIKPQVKYSGAANTRWIVFIAVIFLELVQGFHVKLNITLTKKHYAFIIANYAAG